MVAVGEGQAIISYSYDYSDKDGENKGNGNIIYNVEKPQVEDSSLSIGVGETRKIKIDGLAGGKQLWKSSNKNTVYVDELGVVTGLKEGKATITLRTGGKKYAVKVNVNGKSDFYDASKDIENYSSLRQSRFITVHFYSSGNFTIEQKNEYKNVNPENNFISEKKTVSEDKKVSSNESLSKNEPLRGDEIPSVRKPSQKKDKSSDDKRLPKNESISENKPSPSVKDDKENKEAKDTKKIYEYGDIKYSFIKSKDGYGVRITGLTEKGKKSEIIEIPAEINGYRVKEISEEFMDGNHAEIVIFENGIDEDIVIPESIKRDGTENIFYVSHKYTVVHEKENIDGTYSISETEYFYDRSGKTVIPDIKKNELYKGFEAPERKVVRITVDDNAKIIYRYKRKTFSVSLNAGRGIEKIEGSRNYKYGEEVKIKAYTKIGYHFNGWSGNGTDFIGEKLESNFFMPDYNIELRADAIPVNYHITYDLDGGSLSVNYPKSYTTESENIVIPFPEKEGYSFEGWVTDKSDKSEKNLVIRKGSYSDIKLLAKWKARTDTPYTVYYELEKVDGTGFETKESLKLLGETGKKILVKLKEYEGFETPEEEYITIKANGRASLTYRYIRKKYDLMISYKKGTNGKSISRRAKYGEKIRIDSNLKKGYKNLTITDENGNKYKNDFTMPARDMNITVSSELEEYLIKYELNNGKFRNGSTNPQKYTVETETFVLEPPVREGYTFSGWTGSNGNNVQQYIKMAKGENFGNKIYKANWLANKYKVTFNSNGGRGDISLEKTYDSEIGKLPIVTKNDFDFVGWFDASGRKINEKTRIPAYNVTYTAKWEEKKYDLVIDTNGGTWEGKTGKVTVKNTNGKKINIAEPTKRHYKFTGWKLTGSGKITNKEYIFGKGAGCITAQWSEYIADANEFEVGKRYFKDDFKQDDITDREKWVFECIDNNYSIDDNSKGYLFIGKKASPYTYGDKNFISFKNEEWNKKIDDANSVLKTNIYDRFSENVRNKMATVDYKCELIEKFGNRRSYRDNLLNDLMTNGYYVNRTKIYVPSIEEIRKYDIRIGGTERINNFVLVRNLAFRDTAMSNITPIGLNSYGRTSRSEKDYRFFSYYPIFAIRKN